MENELLVDFPEIGQLDQKIIDQASITRFPSPILPHANNLSKEEKISIIADNFRNIMKVLGLDLDDESLKHSPTRVATMYVEEVFTGLDPSTFPQISLFDDKFQQGQRPNMVFIKVNFCSFCEHHFVPMNGTASIAYIPNGKLIGFSKIPRIVRFFARRPQIQERLTAQIADALSTLLGTDHVAVSLCAQHQCMIARATESDNSHVITNVLLGDFDASPTLRQEFFEALERSRNSANLNKPN